MRPEPLKLAGIVTVLFGGATCLSATAVGAELPVVAAGRIVPVIGVAAPDETNDGAGDGAGRARGDSSGAASGGARDGHGVREAAGLPFTAGQPGDALWHGLVRVASSAPDALNGAQQQSLSTADAAQFAMSVRGVATRVVQDDVIVDAPPVLDTPAARVGVASDGSHEADVDRGANVAAVATADASLDLNSTVRAGVVVTTAASIRADVAVGFDASDAVGTRHASVTPTRTGEAARSDAGVVDAAVVPAHDVDATAMPDRATGEPETVASIRSDASPAVAQDGLLTIPVASAAPVASADTSGSLANVESDVQPGDDASVPSQPHMTIAQTPDVTRMSSAAIARTLATAHQTVASTASTEHTAPIAQAESFAANTSPASTAAIAPVTPEPSALATAPRLEAAALTLNDTTAITASSSDAAHRAAPAPTTLSTAAQNRVDLSTIDHPTDRTTPHATAGKDDSGGWNDEKLTLVSNDKLETMRGGFDLPSGLIVSFGITREAFVNGALVSSASVNIPDVAHMTTQQAQMLAAVDSSGLIQNGAGNSVPGGLPQTGGTVIQNTLSNQQIQALTTISTRVNSASMMQGLNIANTLTSALNSAIHPR